MPSKELCPILKMRAQLIPLFCVLAVAASAQSPQPPQQPAEQVGDLTPPRAAYSFPQRQTLTYSVDWRVFPAGTAVIRFDQDGDRERISATADTVGAIDMLFHVADRFQLRRHTFIGGDDFVECVGDLSRYPGQIT